MIDWLRQRRRQKPTPEQEAYWAGYESGAQDKINGVDMPGVMTMADRARTAGNYATAAFWDGYTKGRNP